MEAVLNDINALNGVIGSFVCDEEGQPLASALPDIYDRELLTRAGRTAAQTLAGLWIARQRRVGDLDLRFSDGLKRLVDLYVRRFHLKEVVFFSTQLVYATPATGEPLTSRTPVAPVG